MYLWSGMAESGIENELSGKMSWKQAQPTVPALAFGCRGKREEHILPQFSI